MRHGPLPWPAWAADEKLRGWLQIDQAIVLAQLQQGPVATSLLVPLVTATDPQLARPAQGVLGSMKMASGQAAQGLGLLRRALEDTQTEWPYRAVIEADLGMACLQAGDLPEGQRWLEQSRQRFLREQNISALLHSLDQEAAFWTASGQPARARELQERAQAY